MEKSKVEVCKSIRIKMAIPQKINEPVKLPLASNESIIELITKVKTIPPIKETISLFAVKEPRFSSSTSDIYHAVLGELTIEFTICPSIKKITKSTIFPVADKGKNGVKYTRVNAN